MSPRHPAASSRSWILQLTQRLARPGTTKIQWTLAPSAVEGLGPGVVRTDLPPSERWKRCRLPPGGSVSLAFARRSRQRLRQIPACCPIRRSGRILPRRGTVTPEAWTHSKHAISQCSRVTVLILYWLYWDCMGGCPRRWPTQRTGNETTASWASTRAKRGEANWLAREGRSVSSLRAAFTCCPCGVRRRLDQNR